MKLNIALIIFILLCTLPALYGQATANPDTLELQEDIPDSVNVLRNDDGNDLSIASVDTTTFNTIGTVSIIGDSSIWYEPLHNFFGEDSFLYSISVNSPLNPEGGPGNTAVVRVIVAPVNDPPVIATFTVEPVNENDTLIMQIYASDPEGDSISFRSPNFPPFATVMNAGPAQGLLYITPGFDDAGIYENLQVIAADNGNPPMADTFSFDLEVLNVNRDPLLNPIGNQQMSEGDTLDVEITATDPDNDQITLEAKHLPHSFAAFTDSGGGKGNIRFTPSFGDSGIFEGIQIIAEDNGFPVKSDTVEFKLTVLHKNRPPQLNPIPDQEMDEGDTLKLPIYAIDPDGDSLELVFGVFPHFAALVDSMGGKGSIRFTPGFSDAGVYPNLRVTVLERGSTSSTTITFQLTVTNVNRKPRLLPVESQQMGENDTLEVVISASDPDGDNITLSAPNLPAFGTLIPAGNGQGIIRFISNPSYAGVYQDITVIARDNGVGNLADSLEFTLKVLRRPAVERIVIGGKIIFQKNLPVEVDVDANAVVTSVVLYYATSPNPDFSSLIMNKKPGLDVYTATIPGDSVNEFGLKFYIEIEDELGMKNIPEVFYKSVTVPAGALSRALDKDRWLMFSLPFNSSDKSIEAILQKLGKESDERWRIFRTSPSGIGKKCYGFRQLQTMGAYGRFEPGNAFWLFLKHVDSQVLSFPEMETLKGDSALTCTLQPGWNQIGSPFAFAMPWSRVETEGAAGNIVVYARERQGEKDGWSLDLFGSDTPVLPYEGYAVYNDSDSLSITFYPQGRPGSNAPLGKASPEIAWKATLRAENQRSFAKALVGMAGQAKPERDKLDHIVPPPVGEHYVCMFFRHPEWETAWQNFSSDFRPLNETGETWHVTIMSSSQAATVRLEGTERLPANFQAALFDRKFAETYFLEEGGEAVLPDIAEGEDNRFALLIGTREYIANELSQIGELLPGEFRLLQNYPNPFNPETVIPYYIPAPGRVKITIYNLLGQEVRVLIDRPQEAGFHKARWDGADNYGNRAASGIYFYRLNAGQFTQTLKMLKIH